MQQVKDCVRAARGGIEWSLADGVRGAGHGSASPHSSGAVKAPGELGAGGRGASRGRGRPDAAQAAAAPANRAWHERANLGGALVAWVGVVGMFLSLLPLLYRRSKRPKPCPDRGPKVTSV
jgi:hypothetical protein